MTIDTRLPSKPKNKKELDEIIEKLQAHLEAGWSYMSFGKFVRGGTTSVCNWIKAYPEIKSLRDKYQRKQLRAFY